MKFEGFMDILPLTDGVVELNLKSKIPADPAKGWVPSYEFDICVGGEVVGQIRLRIGMTDYMFLSGQVGYNVDEAHSGNGYATRAAKLIVPVAKFHEINNLLITTDINNIGSNRVCQKLGANLVETLPTPEWHDTYAEGWRETNIYEWNL
ncbi:MAG: GNAT family N-acetyltransferase [Defluviitaleaceae bacterium]|nr:GNAT family N-acetyltransferase [Defluviitaleaceae bacterium]